MQETPDHPRIVEASAAIDMARTFTPEETRALARALDGAGAPACPRCGTPLDRRNVPPRRDVSYVRDRVWLLCPGCHATGVVDRREDS